MGEGRGPRNALDSAALHPSKLEEVESFWQFTKQLYFLLS